MLVRLDSSAHGGINPGLPGNAYTSLVKENGVYVYILKSADIKTKATGPCGEAQYQIFPSVNSENAGIVANFGLAVSEGSKNVSSFAGSRSDEGLCTHLFAFCSSCLH